MNPILSLYEDLTGVSAFKVKVNDLEKQLYEVAIQRNDALSKSAIMTRQYDQLLVKILELQTNISKMQQLRKEDIDKMNELISLNQKFVYQLDHITANSIFKKECPVLLKEVDSKQVMLATFLIQTSNGKKELRYPSHPSIFFPCPYYEKVLDAAELNRQVSELSPIEICTKIANVMQSTLKYRKDADQWFGYLDNWTIALLADMLGGDDCESLSANILSAILYWQIKYGAFKDYSVFLGLGHFTSFGHGFVLVLHDSSTNLKDSYIIEATAQYADTSKHTLEAEKNYYKIDWNIIGYVREDYTLGTYAVKDEFKWWTTDKEVGEKITMGIEKKKVGTLDKILMKIGLKEDPAVAKRKAIEKHLMGEL